MSSLSKRIDNLEQQADPDPEKPFACVYFDDGSYWLKTEKEHNYWYARDHGGCDQLTEEQYQELCKTHTIFLVRFVDSEAV